MFIDAIGMSFMQSTLIGGFPVATTGNVSNIANDFFSSVLRNPSKHMIVVIFFAVLAIGTVLGSLFLIKKIYDKCVGDKLNPPKHPSQK